jgi:hypothetical protein
MRIVDHHQMKTPNGLNELESEPAYARKKSLDSPRYSEQSNVSRYSLNSQRTKW